MAENILHILRPDSSSYTPLEAKTVWISALILHMEHGGGNNSSFHHACGYLFPVQTLIPSWQPPSVH